MADGFDPIRDRDSFVQLVAGKTLRNRLYGVQLIVAPNGQIGGTAVGWDLTGTWEWKDGYFCREIDWSGSEIAYNCQLVEVSPTRVRFTVDRGAGDAASFRLE